MEPIDHAPEGIETLRDIVRYAASRFNEAGLVFGHGTDNAIDEAAALALHALHLPADLPDPYWGARLTRGERAAVMARVRRRIEERLPLPYITHETYFAGLPFYVDQRVLVPRSPLAELIEAGFRPWLDPERVERVLEIGTGSGCIAVACAYAFPYARVDATDVDLDALDVAAINVHRHDLEDRVALVEADVYEGLPQQRRYQLIVTNPPYVDASAMAALPAEYRHEPRRALAAGEDGLTVVRRILHGAGKRLAEDGILVVEVGDAEDAVAEAFGELPLTWLELERGGYGVFLLTGEQLQEALAAGTL
ncbi:MAG: 50S ribosomal protein L3 N(5)-glutamine methyltransferase [Halorhodospira sp.]